MSSTTVEARAAAATFAQASGAGFLLTLALVHFAKGDLDPSWQPISAYALGAHGWLMTLAFWLWGLCPIGLFFALRPHVTSWGGGIGRGFLLIGAAGPILAAIFPMDSIAAGAEGQTISGQLHSLGAVLGDGIPIASALLTWSLVRRNPAWRGALWPLVWSAALTWVGVVLLTACLAVYMPRHGGTLGPDVPIGWPSRFMIVAQVAWLLIAAVFAKRVTRDENQRREQPVPDVQCSAGGADAA